MPEGVEIQITASAKGAEDEITRLRGTLRGLQGDASNTSGTDQCRDSLNEMGAAGKMTAKRLEDLTETTKQQTLQSIKAAKAQSTFMNTVGKVTKMMILRTAIRSMMKAVKEGIDNLYEWSKLHDKTFAKAMDTGATNVLYMKNSLATALAPAIIAIMPLITRLADAVNWVSNAVAQFIAIVTGQDSWIRAKRAEAEYTTGIKETNKAIKELLADWDELNIIQSETGKDKDDGMPSISSMFEEVQLEGMAKKVSDIFKKFQTPLGKLLEIVLAIKAGFLAIKFAKAFLTRLGEVKNWATTLWNKIFGNGKQNLSNLGEGIDLTGLSNSMGGLSEALNGLKQIDWSPLSNFSNLQWLKDFDFSGLKGLSDLDLSGLNPFKDLLGMFSAGGIAKTALIGGGIALFIGFLRNLSNLKFGDSKKEVDDLQTKLNNLRTDISTIETDMNGIFDRIYEYASSKMTGALERLSTSIGEAMRRISILKNWINLSVKPSLNFGGMGSTNGMFSVGEDELRQMRAPLALLPPWIKSNVLSIIEYDVQQSAAQVKADANSIRANVETNYSTLPTWIQTSVLQPIQDNVASAIETIGGFVDRVSVQSEFALLPSWIKTNVLSIIEYDVQQSVAQIKADFAGVPANFQTVLTGLPGWIKENIWDVIISDVTIFRKGLKDTLDLAGLVDDWKLEFNALPSHVTGTLAGVLLYCVVFRALANAALNLTGMINDWKSKLSEVPGWILDNPMKDILNNVSGFVKGVNGYLAGIERFITITVTTVYLDSNSSGVLGLSGGSRGSSTVRRFGTTNLPTIPRKSDPLGWFRASGGLLNSGQLYMTRENGIPEFVGSFGNQGAVANNDQIVEGIASGVSEANSVLDSRLARLESLMERLVNKKFFAEVRPSTALARVNRQSEEMRVRTEGA